MSHTILDEARPLLEKLREVCDRPPPGIEPWKGERLLSAFEGAVRACPDRGAFYLDFVDGILDLVEDEDEERILRRLTRQAFLSEGRVLADSPGVRDHLAHDVQVFLVGWLVINSSPAFVGSGDGFRPYGWDGDERERFEKLNRAWLYTGLLHDVAYSVESAPRALRHEIAVGALFRDLYETGRPGRPADARALERASEPMWQLRNSWLGEAALPVRDIARALRDTYRDGKHSLVGGLLLWREADDLPEPQKALLRPAAVAVACHHFRPRKKRGDPLAEQIDRWLRLDMAEEPLAALLHICDELQEWSRERSDLESLHRRAVHHPFVAWRELRRLEVGSSQGIVVDAGIRHHLFPEERRLAGLARREREAENARNRTSMRWLLEGRSTPPELAPRLRVEHVVEDLPCHNKVTVDWPEPGGDLERLLVAPEPVGEPERLVDVRVAVPPEKGLHIALRGGRTSLVIEERVDGPGARCVVVAPGGSGKSTLFRMTPEDTRVGASPAVVRYLEQFPAEPSDLEQAVSAIRVDGSKHVVLLLDHLDRLVEDEFCGYWIEQIRSLPDEPWLHVIAACRPEEHERYLAGSLGEGFATVTLEGRPSLLVDGQADEKGRPLPCAIVDRIFAEHEGDIWTVAALAVDMGTARAADRSVPRRAPHFGDRPIMYEDATGRARFVHDSVQDALSSLWLARELASAGERPPERADRDARRLARELERLPRDVPRMLFGLLAGAAVKHLGAEQRRRAVLALARGLLLEPATQQWLYDTGRLEQSADALDGLLERHRDHPVVKLLCARLLSHVEYGRFQYYGLSERRERAALIKKAERLVIRLAESARAAEKLLVDPESSLSDDERWACRWVVLIASDHILITLSRVLSAPLPGRDAARIAASASRLLTARREPSPLEPGWLSSLLERAARTARGDDFDGLFENLDRDLSEFTEHGGEVASRWLDVRRGILAGHIGNRFVERADTRSGEEERLEKAVLWYQRSIARRERVLRRMARDPGRAIPGDRWATRGQGLSDVAVQHGASFYATLYRVRGEPLERSACLDLLDAHERHERVWDIARAGLDPKERFAIHRRTMLPALAIGRALEQAVRSPGITVEDVGVALREQAVSLLRDVSIEAEQHPRYVESGNDPGQFYRHVENRVGDPAELVVGLARELAGDP